MKTEDLKNSVRAIPDYPKPGINFRDITTVLSDKRLFQRRLVVLKTQPRPWHFDIVAGHAMIRF